MARQMLWTAGLVLLVVQHVIADGGEPWRPKAEQRASQTESALEGSSTMRCVGQEPIDRACLMRDLYYDVQSRIFTWYGTAIILDQGQSPVSANADNFARATSFLKEAKEIGGWDIVWAPGPPPDEPERSKTCTVAVPMHLRQEEPVGTYSYGHMLRDNFYFLVTIPHRFATSASAFAWVTYPRTEGNNAKWRLPILNKINALLSPHQDRRWFEVEKSCREEANPLGAETGAREPRYILVREALLSGMSNRWWTTEGEACKRAQYSALRDHAWSIYGIQPKAARKPADRIRMTFLIKAESDRRQMLVGPEVLDAVRTNFPQIDIDLQVASAQEQSVQLRWLAETDIFVSNIGSASFRMLYLPDGAQVILAGSLEGHFEDEHGTVATQHKVFREAETCWDHQAYFKIHRYHITSKDDVALRPLEEARASGDAGEDAAMALRDSHIRLRPGPLVQVVQAAVRSLQAHAESRRVFA